MSIQKYTYLLLASMLTIFACEPNLEVPAPSAGNIIDLSKYVAIGNSLTAGYADGGLYLEGQQHSYPSMIAQQMNKITPSTFSQPLMPAGNGSGYYSLTELNANESTIELTWLPEASGWENKVTGPFNNLGVPGIRVLDIAFNGYAHANDYFGRMVSDNNDSYIEYATAADPTFFTSWLGNNDVLGYATSGGAYGTAGLPSAGGLYGITDPYNFNGLYNLLLQGLMADGQTKGLLGTIPDITLIPFFTTLPYIIPKPLDANTVAALNSAQAFGGYNAALDYLVLLEQITADQAAQRKVVYSEGYNPFLIEDKDLEDLSEMLGNINPALAVFGQTRQATPFDIILFTAQTVVGTPVIPGNSSILYGISYPMPDQYVLIPSEIANIKEATVAYNEIIVDLADEYGLALFDANEVLQEVKDKKFVNGVTLTSQFINGGTFSLDGVHLTPRGYALVANEMIKAINAEYGSTIAPVDISSYRGVIIP